LILITHKLKVVVGNISITQTVFGELENYLFPQYIHTFVYLFYTLLSKRTKMLSSRIKYRSAFFWILCVIYEMCILHYVYLYLVLCIFVTCIMYICILYYVYLYLVLCIFVSCIIILLDLVCSVIFLLAIMLSVLLQITDSD
jgi:hypothetical protein